MEPVTCGRDAIRKRFCPQRSSLASVAVVGALVAVALVPATAAADHLTGSTKRCEPQDQGTQTFNCTLTVNFNQPVGIRGTIFSQIESSPVNATFATTPIRTGGTCPAGAEIRQFSPTQAGIGPPLPTGLPNEVPCTYVLAETLRADRFGEVCQVLSVAASEPPQRVCAQLRSNRSLPATKDECKQGGWQQYGVFRNQGDCVSFVATRGENEPGEG